MKGGSGIFGEQIRIVAWLGQSFIVISIPAKTGPDRPDAGPANQPWQTPPRSLRQPSSKRNPVR